MIIHKKASLEGIAQLVDLDLKCFNRDFDNNFTEKEFKEIFKKDGETGFIYNDNVLVGYYSYVTNPPEIMAVAILPEHQKKGYGTQSVKLMLEKLDGKVKIVTHPKNIHALKLYLNLDFIISGYSPGYYGPNQPRVVLYHSKKS